MKRTRLDILLVSKKLASTRSQAENLIKLGKVKVDSKSVSKSGALVNPESKIELTIADENKYVSRAGYKLESAINKFKVNFKSKTVLDVGSSTGGFSELSLTLGASKVIAVEKGKDQMSPSLRGNPRVELHEQTDILNFKPDTRPDIILIDVSFTSLKHILPSIYRLAGDNTEIVALFKPQFETEGKFKHKGVVKNEKIRRELIRSFETWLKDYFVIKGAVDSNVLGSKGNKERFYLLKKLKLNNDKISL